MGAYVPSEDMVLVMDVARFKYPPHVSLCCEDTTKTLSPLAREGRVWTDATFILRAYTVGSPGIIVGSNALH